MVMRIRAVFAVAVVAPLAAGCAAGGEVASAPRQTTVVRSGHAGTRASAVAVPRPSPVRPAPSAATGAPPAAPGSPPRITIRRTGGFAGVDQSLTVRPDGVWAWVGAPGAGGGRLTAAQRARLARLAGLPALAAEARRKPGPHQCADGFTYTLTVGSLTLSWVDCDPVTPPTAVAIAELLIAATPL